MKKIDVQREIIRQRINAKRSKNYPTRKKANYVLKKESKKIINRIIRLHIQGEKKSVVGVSKYQPIRPPKKLSFEKLPDETYKFLYGLRQSLNGLEASTIEKDKRGRYQVQSYFDFSKIMSISTSALIVLAASYDRRSGQEGEKPPIIEYHTWKRPLVENLSQVGFFELFDHTQLSLTEPEKPSIMKMMRCTNADDLDNLHNALKLLIKDNILRDETFVNETLSTALTIISEASSNVTQHAYPRSHEFEYNHMNSFWITAEVKEGERTITFVFYDQGVTIPISYPKMDMSDQIKKYLQRTIRLFTAEQDDDRQDDGVYVRAAMRYGNSSKKKKERGLGLPDMLNLVKKTEGSSLMIRSRNGWCSFEKKFKSGYSKYTIGGTLIKWTIRY